MTTLAHGTVAPGFEPLHTAFEAAFKGRPDMGAALAIRHEGRAIVDLWGGVSDARTRTPWSHDTLSVIFSCTKGLVSILAARLVQEGRLDYEAPVTRYWPEFAASGKANVRVKDLIAHRSGLAAPREALTLDQILDWDTVVSRLAAQEPLWEPGTGHAYHAITHGWLIGEVIRRITGQSVGQYFADMVADPLRTEAWIGLPDGLHDRVAHLQVGPTLARFAAEQAEARTQDETDWPYQAMTLGGALPVELVGEKNGFNLRSVQSAEIPGAGGIGTARALAAIWSATIIETDGIRLLDAATVEAATSTQSEGAPVWDDPGPSARWGMGFQLDSEPRRYVTDRGFGHDGAGGQSAFADPGAGVGFAFVTNQMEAVDDRATRIIDALRYCLDLDV